MKTQLTIVHIGRRTASGTRPVSALLMRLLWAVALLVPAIGAQAGVIFTSLYSFTGTNDGANPIAGLVQGSDGDFYGTTYDGGTNGVGTVFKISANGALASLYSFNGENGANPEAGLVQGGDGNLYGTTYGGGTNDAGTVFKVSATGALTSLYSFTGTNDGAHPEAGLAWGSDGNFYGTTARGGTNGVGTVFRVSTNGALATLYSFTGGTDGWQPNAGLVRGSDGNFYGTTFYGGTNEGGTVFSISTDGALTNLYSFTGGTNGEYPYAGLVQGGDGNFYGTTSEFTTAGNGTVFRISTNGALTSLYSFTGGDDGATPFAGLAQGSDGNFYGTAEGGGGNGAGTVFKITTNGALTTLYTFTGGNDGENPYAGLAQDNHGSFYGTTYGGGTNGLGTVFRLTFAPEFQSVTLTNGTIFLTWSTQPGATYQLQYLMYTFDLSSASWANFGHAVTAAGPTLTAADVDVTVFGGPRRYYRVLLLP